MNLSPTKATYTAYVPLGTLQRVAGSHVFKWVDKPLSRMTSRSLSSLGQEFLTQGLRPRNLGSRQHSWIEKFGKCLSLEEG